ncbi:hypothetical protein MIDIC_110091 [Alphaproteobacteria bacterium]
MHYLIHIFILRQSQNVKNIRDIELRCIRDVHEGSSTKITLVVRSKNKISKKVQ